MKNDKWAVGMVGSYAWPITAEPDNSHPTYGAKVDMGTAVKGTLAITTNTIDLPGDDEIQLHTEEYVSHQMDAETNKDDLELNAFLYGHAYTDGAETSNKDDGTPFIGYGFTQSILKPDKSRIYRATFFYKMSALKSAEKTEAETKGTNLNPKTHAISLFGQCDNTGAWRARKDFNSLADAEAYLDQCAGATGKYLVNLAIIGNGTADKPASSMATAGQSFAITFSAAPTKVFDQTGSSVTDVTAQVSSKVLTLSSLAANHSITAIFS